MLSPVHLPDLYYSLLKTLVDSMGRKRAVLFLQESASGLFLIESWRGYDGSELPNIQLQSDDPLICHLSAHPIPTSLGRLERNPSLRLLERPNWGALKMLGGEVVIPLFARNSLSGFLLLGPRKADMAYPEEDEALLSIIGNQLALTIDTARLYQQLSEAYQELSATRKDLVQSEPLRALGLSPNRPKDGLGDSP